MLKKELYFAAYQGSEKDPRFENIIIIKEFYKFNPNFKFFQNSCV